MNLKLKIFNNNLKHKSQFILFKIKKSDYRERYEAPVSKEWKNTVYSFYKNSLRNISVNDLNLNRIIKSYFDFFFINKFIHYKSMSVRRRSSLLRRIHVSNVEIKQTNNKAIITLFIMNTEKNRLLDNYLENIPSGIYRIISKSNMKYDYNKDKFIESKYNKMGLNIMEYTKKIFKDLKVKYNNEKSLRISKLYFSLNEKTLERFKNIVKLNGLKGLFFKEMKHSLIIYKWFYLSYQTIFFIEKEIRIKSNEIITSLTEKKIRELKRQKNLLKKTIDNLSKITKKISDETRLKLMNGTQTQIGDLCQNQAISIDKQFKNLDLLVRKDSYAYDLYCLKINKTYFYLFKLSNFFTRILNKKIEFNIINLKSLTYSTDIFTKALALKLRKRKLLPLVSTMRSLINRAKLPTVNTIAERTNLKGFKDLSLVQNRFKDTYLFSGAINNLLLKHFLKEIQTNKKVNHPILGNQVFGSIFNTIKYKNTGGMRLEVKGRLTRRYRADRAVYKLVWKGGLKNIESSFNKLSSILYRGHFKSNIISSVSISKRRVGAFAVKGWMSAK